MKEKEKVVLIAGTFDILHPGHLYFIREAGKLGKVVVVVGTDRIVERLKGKPPIIPEKQRLHMIEGIKGVDRVILGYETMDFSRIVSDVNPDIILLGPDQGPDEETLKKMLEEKGLGDVEIIRVPERKNEYPLTSTSAIIERVLKLNRVEGIEKQVPASRPGHGESPS